MRTLVVSTALAALTLVSAHPGLAQTSEELKGLRKEVEGLREGQAAIQKDLQELKTRLRTRPAPAQPQAAAAASNGGLIVSLESAPFKGDKNAKVTIVEWTDYQ